MADNACAQVAAPAIGWCACPASAGAHCAACLIHMQGSLQTANSRRECRSQKATVIPLRCCSQCANSGYSASGWAVRNLLLSANTITATAVVSKATSKMHAVVLTEARPHCYCLLLWPSCKPPVGQLLTAGMADIPCKGLLLGHISLPPGAGSAAAETGLKPGTIPWRASQARSAAAACSSHLRSILTVPSGGRRLKG